MERQPKAPRPPTRVLVALLLTGILLAACEPPDDRGTAQAGAGGDGYAVSLKPIGNVSMLGFAFEVAVTQGGAPVTGAAVTIVGEMTHAGMPRLEWRATEVEPGRYRLDTFTPTMPGDWIITAEVVPVGASKVTSETFLTISR